MNGRTRSKSLHRSKGRYGENVTNENMRTKWPEDHERIYPHRIIHKLTWIQNTRNVNTINNFVILNQKTALKANNDRIYRSPTFCKIKWGSAHVTEEHSAEPQHNKKIEQTCYKLERLEHGSTRKLHANRLDAKPREVSFENSNYYYKFIKNALNTLQTKP